LEYQEKSIGKDKTMEKPTPINLQVMLKGVYAETYRAFIKNNPECETHRDTMSAILRTLPEHKKVMQEKELAINP